MAWAHSFSSSSSIFSWRGAGRSKSGEGRRKLVTPLAIFGDADFLGEDLLLLHVAGKRSSAGDRRAPRSQASSRSSRSVTALASTSATDCAGIGGRPWDLISARRFCMRFCSRSFVPGVVPFLQRADDVQLAERTAQRLVRFDERKFCGQEQRDEKDRHRHQICADGVESREQRRQTQDVPASRPVESRRAPPARATASASPAASAPSSSSPRV